MAIPYHRVYLEIVLESKHPMVKVEVGKYLCCDIWECGVEWKFGNVILNLHRKSNQASST